MDLANTDTLSLLDASFKFYLALVANGARASTLKEDSGQAVETYNAITSLLKPWNAKTGSSRDNELSALWEAYVRRFGDPNDPEVKKRLDEGLAALNARHAQTSDDGVSAEEQVRRNAELRRARMEAMRRKPAKNAKEGK